MMNNTFKKFAAVMMTVSSLAGFAPVQASSTIEFSKPEMMQNAMAKLPGASVSSLNQKAHSVKVNGAAVEFSGKFTASFLNNIRKGNNRLSYNGNLADAKTSLSELVSFYCSLGTTVQFYECKDAQGTFLEITEAYWNVVCKAVEKADAGWKAYEAAVEEACASLNLNTSDKELVDQINNYICANYEYKVTNAGMPNFMETRKGQCWHYAKMFADMCNAVGIKAEKVENKEHAWNEVTVEGVTYTFDVTYNDTGDNWTAYSWMNASKKASSNKNAWVQVNGKWQYADANGNLVKSTWIQTSGKWYYVKADGTMARDTWVDGCYVNADGVCVK